MKNTVALVTGGAGFIGSHLCRALIAQGIEVRILDLQSPKQDLAGAIFKKGDVRNRGLLIEMLKGADVVFHYAATVSVPLCQTQPLESYGNNLGATLDVLEAISQEQERKRTRIRLVFASSSVVYGNLGQQNTPLKEGHDLPSPISFYGAQKLACEHAIRLYAQDRGVPSIVFRFFNVFGAGQDPSSPYSGVLSIFADAAKNGRALRLNGGGIQTRDFISVKEIARAGVLALSAPESAWTGSPLNLGSGHSLRIYDLASKVVEVAGSKSPIEYAEPRIGDVMHSCADISQAEKVLGWSPRAEFEAGLRELLG